MYWIVAVAFAVFYFHSMCELLGTLRGIRYGRVSNHLMVVTLLLSPLIMGAGYAWAIGRFVLSRFASKQVVFAVAAKNR